MSVNIRDYVSNDHIESIGEIAKSQSAIIQALSIDNSKLQQELQIKDNEIKQLQEDIVNHIKIASEYKEQMIIKDNIINELKEYLKLEIAEWQDVDNIPTRARVEEDKDILYKIKELESK